MTICVNSQWVKWKTISDAYYRYSFIQKKQMWPSLINSRDESRSSLWLSTQTWLSLLVCFKVCFPILSLIDQTLPAGKRGEEKTVPDRPRGQSLLSKQWEDQQLLPAPVPGGHCCSLDSSAASGFSDGSLPASQLNALDPFSTTVCQRDTMKKHGKKVLIQHDIICCWPLKPSWCSTEWNAMLEVKGPGPEAENQSLSLA